MCHSTVVLKLVLDILTATKNFIFQITVIPSAYPHHYSEAFAFESIFPTRRIRLAPALTSRSENERAVTSFLIVMVRVFRAILSTGVRGSACWSTRNLPTPHYPCPFWDSQRISLFRWLFLTMVQTYLCFPTHKLLLDDYWIWLPAISPFTPASGIDG